MYQISGLAQSLWRLIFELPHGWCGSEAELPIREASIFNFDYNYGIRAEMVCAVFVGARGAGVGENVPPRLK